MKFLTLFLAVLCVNAQDLHLKNVRALYKEAAHDKSKVEELNIMLASVTKKSSPELLAYKGAAIALRSKKAKALKTKKQLFIEGISLVELSIKNDSKNIENRFIRLGIQENTPKLLKYKGQIPEDKAYLLKHLKNVRSKQLHKDIKEYILQSKVFSDQEKAVILGT